MNESPRAVSTFTPSISARHKSGQIYRLLQPYDPLIMFSRKEPISLAVLISLLGACSPSPHVTPTPSPAAAKTAPTPAPHSWHPSRQATALRYMLRDSSTLSVSSDTSTKQIPFITTAFLQLVVSAAGDSFTFSGTSESTLVQSEFQKTMPENATLRIYGTLSQDGAVTQVQSSGSSLCKIGVEPGAARLSELLIRIPATVSIGTEWTDSSSITICHGRTPLRQTAIRFFRLMTDTTWGVHPALRVDVSTQLTISGIDADSADRMSATGTGSSTSILLLDANTGALLQSSTYGKAVLTISTGRGTFPFQQTSFTRIEQQ